MELRNQGHTNQGQGQGRNTQAPEREPLRIKVESIPFDGLLKSKITTTVELAKTVNSLFRPVLSDYEGSIILPNQYGQLELVLYFLEKGQPINGAKKTLLPANANHTRNLSPMDKIKTMNMRNRFKSYDLTEDAKEMLSEFIWVKPGKGINWDEHLVEQTQQGIGSYAIYVKVLGLDLMKILKKIYGGRDSEKKSRIDYNISILRRVGIDLGQGSYGNQNFLINIVQADADEVNKIAASVGFIPTNGQMPIIR